MHGHVVKVTDGGGAVPPPFLVSYAVTGQCNLKCRHCYSDSTEGPAPGELSTEEAKGLLDDIAGWGIRLLIFDGGEPLCRGDFLELAAHASGRGMRTVIGSNGTLIDDGMAARLRAAGVMAVQISIDGATAATHDWFRGVEGAFERALGGARACKAAGLPFQFGMTIRRGTLDELPGMLALAVESGATAAEMFDLVQVRRVREKVPQEVLSPGERKKVMVSLAEAQEDYPIVIRVPGCPMYTLVLQAMDVRPRHFGAEQLRRIPYYGRGCAAGMPHGYITVLPNGDAIPCMLLQARLGNVRDASIMDIWQRSPVLATLRDRALLEGRCGACCHRDACAGCRGRAYEETGSLTAADPGCWVGEDGRVV